MKRGMQKRTRHIDIFITAFALVWIWLSASSCDPYEFEGKILIVRSPATENESGSHFSLLNPEDGETRPLTLGEEFFLVGSPDVSFDGERLLFEAKRNSNDPWQIWELHLRNTDLKQVTGVDSNCRFPAYLPDGRIVYSRYVEDEIISGYHVLETCELNGNNRMQITFDPVDYTNSTVLSDGRLLCTAKEVFPAGKEVQLMVMRPDGTKIELFYETESRTIQAHEASETREGHVLFSERSDQKGTDSKLVSVRYNNPLGSRDELTFDSMGDFKSVTPGLKGEIMTTFRSEDQGVYGLYAFAPDLDPTLRPLCNDPQYNIVDAKLLVPRDRPKKLPSAVDPDQETALLLCQDANLIAAEDKGIEKKAVKVQLLGLQGSLGEADLEEDGSVYLKVAADIPFRMQTLDEDGSLVQGPSSWINLRPNERRGCVGCHADHDRVPINRQPLAVQKAPVEITKYGKAVMADALKTGMTHE